MTGMGKGSAARNARAKALHDVNSSGASWLALVIGLTGLAFATSAHAADQPATVEPATPASDAPAAAIVVTGSRITRQDYKSDSPISTISSEAIAAAGSPSLDRALGEMPQFEAAQGASEVGDAQSSVGFGGGASYSDLRGIGRNRSLVLMGRAPG